MNFVPNTAMRSSCFTSKDCLTKTSPKLSAIRSAPSRPGCTGRGSKSLTGSNAAAWFRKKNNRLAATLWGALQMTCSEFQQLIQQRLDGELVDRAVLDAHLAECAD